MYYFIINPASKSGLGKSLWTGLKTELDRQEIDYRYYFTKRQLQAFTLVQEILCLEGEKHIVVIGGDGTLNEVVNGFDSYENATLSYIPAGSGNDFARGIGLSKNPYKLLASLLEARTPILYDQGLCLTNHPPDSAENIFKNGRRFAISSGIGFDAAICYETVDSKLKPLLNKMKLGKLTYVLIALKQIRSCQLVDAEVLIDGTHKKLYPNIFFIAGMNQPFEGGGFRMSPFTDSQDRKLSVAVFYNMSKFKALMMLPCVLFGWQTHFQGYETFDCQTLEIKTHAPMPVHTDGECAGIVKHLTLSVLPQPIHYLK